MRQNKKQLVLEALLNYCEQSGDFVFDNELIKEISKQFNFGNPFDVTKLDSSEKLPQSFIEKDYCLSHLFAGKYQMTSKPFVKWAGGKRDLIKTLISFMPKNFNNYFEPFIGGGVLFFALKNVDILDKKNIFLNDKNKELINSYKAVRDNPFEILTHLKDFQNEHSKEFFYQIRSLDRESNFENLDSIFRAARFIYLNKTCFNGLCRYNAKGQFNVPMGSYKNPRIYDKDLILNASATLQGVEIVSADFEEVCLSAKKGDFIYFDPPYFPLNKTSSFVSYTDNFLENDQVRLCELFKKLDSIGVKVLLSNSNTPFIRELYKDFAIFEVQAKRAINCKGDKRGKISELIIKGNYE